jgi:hypothetical protein
MSLRFRYPSVGDFPWWFDNVKALQHAYGGCSMVHLIVGWTHSDKLALAVAMAPLTAKVLLPLWPLLVGEVRGLHNRAQGGVFHARCVVYEAERLDVGDGVATPQRVVGGRVLVLYAARVGPLDPLVGVVWKGDEPRDQALLRIKVLAYEFGRV